jgi:hypothetical protein
MPDDVSGRLPFTFSTLVGPVVVESVDVDELLLLLQAQIKMQTTMNENSFVM